jgi:predicted negative regulator of RcsB-dependent stress response
VQHPNQLHWSRCQIQAGPQRLHICRINKQKKERHLSFFRLISQRLDDLLFAQNKTTEARAAYKVALDKTDIKNPARQLIQLKLDALGGADATAT